MPLLITQPSVLTCSQIQVGLSDLPFNHPAPYCKWPVCESVMGNHNDDGHKNAYGFTQQLAHNRQPLRGNM